MSPTKSSVQRMHEERAARWGVSVEVACGLGIAQHNSKSSQRPVQAELEHAIAEVTADPVGTPGRDKALRAYRGALAWVQAHGGPPDG